MKRPTAVIPLMLILFLVSCSDDYPYDFEQCQCHCHNNGNVIDGWEDNTDTTDVSKKDPASGFEVTLDGWGNPEKQDAHL